VAEKNALEVQTPFGVRVVVPRGELSKGQAKIREWPGQFPLDREVIEYLYRQFVSAEDKGLAPD